MKLILKLKNLKIILQHRKLIEIFLITIDFPTSLETDLANLLLNHLSIEVLLIHTVALLTLNVETNLARNIKRHTFGQPLIRVNDQLARKLLLTLVKLHPLQKMHIDVVLNVGYLIVGEQLICAGEVINFRTDNVREQRLEQLEKDILHNHRRNIPLHEQYETLPILG